MTLIKPFSDPSAIDENLVVAEELFAEAGERLGKLLLKAKQTGDEDIKALTAAVTDLSAGWKMAVVERNRVAEERKKARGIVGDYAIDFDAAREEIGRRLACLRDAGDG